MTVSPRRALRRLAPVVAPLAFFLYVTLPGIDFGYHWDERHGQMGPLGKSLAQGTLLPGHYIYPGLNYWINLSALAPDFLRARAAGDEIWPALAAAAESHEAALRARRIRLLLSSLSLVWTYLIVLALGRSVPEAFLAASVLACSWEVAYHSRWPAPDTVLMQFGALSLLAAILTLVRPRRAFWPHLAAAAAALACGIKYPGGIFLVFAILALVLREDRLDAARLRALVKPAVQLGGTFTVVYLLTTPGTVLEARVFFRFIAFMRKTYKEGAGDYKAYTVDGMGEHLGGLVRYLTTLALSPYLAAALLLFALALVGAVRLLRESPRRAALLLGFPALYVLYFSLQKLLIMRNYLALMPCLAVLAALGTGDLWRRFPRSWARGTLALLVPGVLAPGAVWQVDASRSIVERDTEQAVADLAGYIDRRSQTRFLVSSRVAAALDEHDGRRRGNVFGDGSRLAESGERQDDEVVCYLYELGERFPANLMPGFSAWFGPREVNLDIYSSWRGDDRPVVLPAHRASQLRLLMSQTIRRRIVFPPAPALREAVVLAGDAEAGDQLYVDYAPEGVSWGIDQWGEEAHLWVLEKKPWPIKTVPVEPFEPVDRTAAVEAGRPYELAVKWDVLRGTVEVRLDGDLVFAQQGDRVTARIDQFHVGAGAAVAGRAARPFSGALE